MTQILAAVALGTGSGLAAHGHGQAANLVADWAGVIAELFLRLIRMIVAPLVLATLAGGIAGMGGPGSDRTSLARTMALAMGWFLAASLLSLALGLLAADLLRPGHGLTLPLPRGPSGIAARFDLRGFIVHLAPSSVLDSMARNDIVQIVVFAALFGSAVAALPDGPAQRLRVALADLAEAMLGLTRMVMRLAPLAVFASLFASFAHGGIALASGYALFIGGFYATMLVLWALLIGIGALIVRRRILTLLRMIAPQVLLGFATASSEAVFPQLVDKLERFGAPTTLVGFVLPLGYAFNLDGAMLFQSFAALFIAQAYGIVLPLTQQIGLLLVLMITSKGTAGVPRAAVVALAAVMPGFGLPDAGLLLILGIDHLLDMGRTATSVLGNAIATAAIASATDTQACAGRSGSADRIGGGEPAMGTIPGERVMDRFSDRPE